MPTLEDLAQGVWDHVCENIVLILRECDMHGLVGILTAPDPSIESRIHALKKLDSICQVVIDNLTDAQYSTARIMYNAKQQILNLEMLLSAAKNGDNTNFDLAKDRLNGQSTH